MPIWIAIVGLVIVMTMIYISRAGELPHRAERSDQAPAHVDLSDDQRLSRGGPAGHLGETALSVCEKTSGSDGATWSA